MMKQYVQQFLLKIGVEEGYWTSQKKKITKKDLDEVYWSDISECQSLSEDFIREFKDKVDWNYISECQSLSEDFIREFQDKVDWDSISASQSLSEEFIREFQDKVDWNCISQYQSLSEGFIREFKDKVYWDWISKYQSLSEDFIREFKDEVAWSYISEYQSLSEDFIREFKDKVNWYCISRSQSLSEEFIEEFDLTFVKENNWLYWTKEQKEKYIRDNTEYQIIDGKVIAFKSVKRNLASVFQPGLIYEVGKTYEAHCDCTNIENSFGLSAWTKEGALKYYSKGQLLKVSIAVEDIGRIVHNNHKIRAKRITILEEV